MELEFEWNDQKAEENFRRHGVDFVDAATVFFDQNRVERFDDREEYGEDRFQTIGFAQVRLLFVVYTEREGKIRLISARPATSEERKAYESTHE